MAEDVPGANAERSAERADVGRIVFDRGVAWSRRRRRSAAPALIVEDDLASLGQRRESGPEHGVVVQHSAVHADERRSTSDGRAGKDREVDSASAHRLAVKRRRARQGASEGDEIGVGHSQLTGGRVDPLTDNIH